MRRIAYLSLLLSIAFIAPHVAKGSTNLAEIEQLIEQEQHELQLLHQFEIQDHNYPETKLSKNGEGSFSFGKTQIKDVESPVLSLSSDEQGIKKIAITEAVNDRSSNGGSDIFEVGGGIVGGTSTIASSTGSSSSLRFDSSSNRSPSSIRNKSNRSRGNKTSNSNVAIAAANGADFTNPSDSESVSINSGPSTIASIDEDDSLSSVAEEPVVNLSPIAVTDSFSVEKDTTLVLTITDQLLVNDSDPEGVALIFSSVDSTSALSGTIINNGDGTITYTPPSGVTNNDSFEYEISDGTNTASGTVEVEIYDPDSLPFVEDTKTGTAVSSAAVASSSVSAVPDHLYLAIVAISDTSNTVTDVQGLGLTWSYLGAKDSNASAVRLEAWYSIGTPSGDGVVTANLSSVADASQISVSRFSGIDTGNPLSLVGDSASAASSKNISYDVNVTVENSVLFSAISYVKLNIFTAGTSAVITDITSGSNPSATGLVVQSIDAPLIQSYTVDGALQSSTNWSSIGIMINSSP